MSRGNLLFCFFVFFLQYNNINILLQNPSNSHPFICLDGKLHFGGWIHHMD